MKKECDSKLLRLEFWPLEPYFFGNDRSLRYPGADAQAKAASYFAVSEKLPLQTTLFGALRYLGITEKSSNFVLSEQDKANIGPESYHIRGTDQNFGKIKGISHLYLKDREDRLYVRAPLESPSERFTGRPAATTKGMRYLPAVDMKQGFPEGFVCISDGKWISDEAVFLEKIQTGIHTGQKEDAYFRKQYYFMQDYAFVIYAQVVRDFPEIRETHVKLGQGKSTFALKVEEAEELPKIQIKPEAPKQVPAVKAVLLSDSYVEDVQKLYGCCCFAHTDTRDYRAFSTVYSAASQKERFRKQTVLLKLLKAGSVFLVEKDKIQSFRELMEDEQARTAGFNYYLTGGNEG